MDRQTFLALIEPAIKLVARKGEDYNASAIQLHEYFPFKDKSYQQMLHMKVLRMRSLLDKGSAPNFDSLLDSLYDLINYSVFYLEYLDTLLKVDKVVPQTGLNKPYKAPNEHV